MTIRAITLDLFNTIIVHRNSSLSHVQRRAAIDAWCSAQEESFTADEIGNSYRAAEVVGDRYFDREIHFSRHLGMREITRHLNIQAPKQAAQELLLEFDKIDLAADYILAPGVRDFMIRVNDRGMQMGIISNLGWQSSETTRQKLTELFIHRFIPARNWVFSDEVGHYKPHRRPFDEAADRLGLDSRECLHVGDTYETDVRGALAAGFNAALLDKRRSVPITEEAGYSVFDSFHALSIHLGIKRGTAATAEIRSRPSNQELTCDKD